MVLLDKVQGNIVDAKGTPSALSAHNLREGRITNRNAIMDRTLCSAPFYLKIALSQLVHSRDSMGSWNVPFYFLQKGYFPSKAGSPGLRI